MHLFLRAIGFAEFDAEGEKKLIESAAAQSPENNLLMKKNEYYGRAELLVPISDSTGICVYGALEDVKDGSASSFRPIYYYPMLMGSSRSDNDELSIERHYDKESYEVICDDLKPGVTLMFYLQNALDYLMYRQGRVESGKEKPDYFMLDRKNPAEKDAISGKDVILSALSVGGMIILPTASRSTSRRPVSGREAAKDAARRNLLAAAKNGDQDAIESLTIEDIDTYNELSNRVMKEDIFTIVDSTFMPCGVELSLIHI